MKIQLLKQYGIAQRTGSSIIQNTNTETDTDTHTFTI